MGLWSKLLRWRGGPSADGQAPGPETAGDEETSAEAGQTIDLPVEPFVFECQSCGKVFEARRKHPRCPECDSRDVSLLAE